MQFFRFNICCFDFATDVALLAEMLEVFLLSLDIVKQEARTLGL